MDKVIKFLNDMELSRIKQRVTAAGVVLIIILILDLHRFGAWYTGNQCHLKPYGVSLICLAGLPPVIYCAAAMVQFCVRRGWYMVLFMTKIYLFCLPFSILYALPFLTVTPDVWYNYNVFREYDLIFLKGIGILLLGPLPVVMGLWILGMVFKFIDSLPYLIRKYLR